MHTLNEPVNLQWELTPVCNHDCIHCYNYWRNDEEPIKHPENADYMALARKIAKCNPVHVVITGGEPLTVYKESIEAIDYLVKRGIYVSWNTNAVLVTDEIAAHMKELNANAFVSLPSANPESCDKITNRDGSLEHISKGIKKLVAAGVPVSVNMVVSSINENEIFMTAKYAKEELGVDSFCMAPASRPFGADEAFDSIKPGKDIIEKMCAAADKIKTELGIKPVFTGSMPGCAFTSEQHFQDYAYTKTCTAGKTTCGITADGDIKACARDNAIYGNLYKESVKDAWERMSEWRDGSLLPDECKSCNDLSMCKGGCRLEACPETGRRDMLDSFANKDFIPVPFKKKRPETLIKDDSNIRIRKGLRFKNEDFGWRVSLGPRFTFITGLTRDILDTHKDKEFTFNSIVKEFGENKREVLRTLFDVLARTGIISVSSPDNN